MRSFIKDLRCWAGRYKVHTALFMLFLSGALFSMAIGMWWFSYSWDNRSRAYDRQIFRLMSDVDEERNINRAKLAAIIAIQEQQSKQTMRNAVNISELLRIAEGAAATAEGAASTAKSAASTAKSAAKNAAKSHIRIREVVPGETLRILK